MTSSGPLRRQLDEALAENVRLSKLVTDRDLAVTIHAPCNPPLQSSRPAEDHDYRPVLRCRACGHISHPEVPHAG